MTVLIKVIVAILFVFIFFSLASALYYLVKDTNSDRIVKALTWRIVISIILFVFLFIAFALGWIHPHAIGQ